MYEAGPAGLVETKLHPPVVHDGTLPREELVARLDAAPGVRLTVLAAPAGSGKTTSLGLWYGRRAARGPVAWVSLDERDADPSLLWLHVLEAVRRACPELGPTPAAEAFGRAPDVELILARLVNELARLGSLALVLDDFHSLPAGPARDSLAWLVVNSPPSLEVVVASRTEPALPLGRLRVRRQLNEIRAEDLRFTVDEALTMLNDRLGLDVAAADVDDLVARTEGWPAGIYLAALSLRGVDDPHAFLARFDGQHRYVVDFLVADVLDAHPPELQDLMLRTSVLERLSGPLCDAVLERRGSAVLLEQLSRSNLFLGGLDDRGEWYRFHHLFRQLLRVELEHRRPGIARDLHRRAFEWFRDQALTDEAMDQALDAGAYDEAADLLCSVCQPAFNDGRTSTVLAWLSRFPRPVMESNTQLILLETWGAGLVGNHGVVAAGLARVEAMGNLSDGPLIDGYSCVEAKLLLARVFFQQGDAGAAMRDAVRAAELEGPESPQRANATAAMGISSYFCGEFDEADRWLAQATDAAQRAGRWVVLTGVLSVRSLIAGLRGDLAEQRDLADAAIAAQAEHSLEDITGDAYLALGESLRASGDPEAALPFLDRGVACLVGHGPPLDQAHALLLQAAVLRSVGEQEAFETALGQAAQALAGCRDPGMLAGRLAELERPIPRPRRRDGELSTRELAVLRMLMGPLSEREIARELYLSHNTVHTHARSIHRKLGVTSRAEAVRKARDLGLFAGSARSVG